MDQRTRILDAAVKHFATHGYRRSTLEGVAAELGLGKTALYYYFKNKRDLFKAVAEREGDIDIARLKEAVRAARDPRAQMRAFCRTRILITMDKVRVHQVTERVHKEVLEMFHRLEVSFFAREAEILAGILGDGVRAKVFRKVDTALAVPLLQQIFQKMDGPGAFFSGTRDVKKRVDFAMDLLLRGLEARG